MDLLEMASVFAPHASAQENGLTLGESEAVFAEEA
jgi:hypothetical protein